MKTIKEPTTDNFREKGSKFIGYLFPASSTEEFDKELQKIQSQYPDATHHCYAWRIDPNKTEEFAQDDGEPSGSAGLPILNQLKSFKIVNCGCVVVRYYGGNKLGKSGLIQAYGYAAELCLQKATLMRLIPTKNFKITYPYPKQKHIDQLKNQFDLKELDAKYLENITLEIACRSQQAEDFSGALKKLQHQSVEVEIIGDSFVTMQS